MRIFVFLFIFCVSQIFAVDTSRVLAREIRGILFSDHNISRMRKNDGIQVAGDLYVPKEEKFLGKMGDYLGKPLTIELLNEIRDEVENYYRYYGFPLVGVRVPAGQDVTDGRIFVIVTIGEVGNVSATGAEWYSEDWIRDQVSLKKGEEIETAPLLGDLHWINKNPFMNTTIVYEKGKDLSQTDIELITNDRFPVRLFGGYENNGNIIAGDSRYFTGFNFGRIFFQNDMANYQFMSAQDFQKWWATAGNYTLPFPWRHILKVFGAYSRARSNVSDPNLPEPMNPKGIGWQIGTRYIVVLPNFVHYYHEAKVGYDFKRTNNFLTFSQVFIFDEFFDISQFIIGYEGTYESNFGFVTGEVSVIFSPGGMTKYNKDAFFAQQRGGAKANYVYGKVGLDGVVRIPLDFSWEFSLLGQAASGKLLPTEELSVGGYLSVRGYDENEVISDQGVLIRNELRTPPIGVLNYGWKSIFDRLQFLAFIDFGWANDVDKTILDEDNKVLASVGPGVRYNIEDFLSFRFDYGFQLDSVSGRVFGSGDHHRMHLGLTVGF